MTNDLERLITLAAEIHALRIKLTAAETELEALLKPAASAFKQSRQRKTPTPKSASGAASSNGGTPKPPSKVSRLVAVIRELGGGPQTTTAITEASGMERSDVSMTLAANTQRFRRVQPGLYALVE